MDIASLFSQADLQTIAPIFQLYMALIVVFTLLLALFLANRWSKLDFPEIQGIEQVHLPNISIVLPTWNEEKVIAAKLDDIESQEYPDNLLEVIIIDSASSDSTIEIVRNWISDKGLIEGEKYRIIQEEKRRGKSYSINRAFEEANPESEILLMSDVDCRLSDGTIAKIANRFGDQSVGAVTGRQVLLNIDKTKKASEEGTYRDFYSRMRVAESKFSSTPIFHGECSAYRRIAISSHRLVENSNADDSQMAVSAVRSGFRALYDPEIIFFEMAPPDSRASNVQKIRRAQGLVRHFWRNKDMLFDRRYGDFRKVMALEFMLHIILPIAVVLGFIAGFSHIFAIIIESGVKSDFLTSSPKLEISMLIADFVVLLLLVSGYLGVPIPGGKLSITFFTYMITLFRAQALIVRGTSLHRWEQVPSVRDELAEFDRKSQQK